MQNKAFFIKHGSVWLLAGSFMLSEVVLRQTTAEHFWGVGLLFSLLFGAAAGVLLGVLCGAWPMRIGRILTNIFLWLVSAVYAAQIIYFKVFKTFFTLFSATKGGQVIEFIGVIFTTLMSAGSGIVIMLLPLLASFLLQRHGVLAFEPFTLRRACITACVAVALHLLALAALPLCGTGQGSAYQLYFNTRVLNASVDKLGLFTTMRHDCSDLWFGFEENSHAGVDKDNLQVQDFDGSSSAAAESTPAANGTADYVRKANVLNIDFTALAQGETNSTIADIHRYIADTQPTYTNEKTGLFKGKNLIFIVAESFSQYVIDKERTPTLYKMQQEGFHFTNYYTGVWGVSTLDGEYTALTGTIPQQNVWSLYQSGYGSMPFTIASLLGKSGYSTYAYHNGLYDYYGRDFSHPNLGYDVYKGVYGGLDMTDEWPRSDAELVDITTDEYMNSEPYHVYYLTISGHLPYNFTGGDAMATKNEAAVANLPYSDAVKAYLAANIELDKAMELLLQRLEKAGQLEDTVIVLCADHYPYGLTNEEIGEMAGHAVDTEFELYRNALLIYNPTLKPETVTKPCSSLDVLPTLCNLFGLDYESRLYSGSDIFSDTPALVPLISRSFITDTVMYNATTNTAVPTTAAPVSADYISEISQQVNQKFIYAAKILQNHYYN